MDDWTSRGHDMPIWWCKLSDAWEFGSGGHFKATRLDGLWAHVVTVPGLVEFPVRIFTLRVVILQLRAHTDPTSRTKRTGTCNTKASLYKLSKLLLA